MSLLVLCPSKGRPEKAAELMASFEATRTLDSTRLRFILDEGEPGLYPGEENYFVVPSGRRGMVDPLNKVVEHLVGWDTIGFVGDDHRFRTRGWDQVFAQILDEGGGGLVYGNDLNWQNGEIPTQIFGSSWVWKALGWMALPACQHLYVDNVWRIVGKSLDRLWYVPEIVIEHVHPAYSKTEWDEGYLAVNNQEMYDRDRAAFEAWQQTDAVRDIERVRQSAPGSPAGASH